MIISRVLPGGNRSAPLLISGSGGSVKLRSRCLLAVGHGIVNGTDITGHRSGIDQRLCGAVIDQIGLRSRGGDIRCRNIRLIHLQLQLQVRRQIIRVGGNTTVRGKDHVVFCGLAIGNRRRDGRILPGISSCYFIISYLCRTSGNSAFGKLLSVGDLRGSGQHFYSGNSLLYHEFLRRIDGIQRAGLAFYYHLCLAVFLRGVGVV